jgi:hypothetical protein
MPVGYWREGIDNDAHILAQKKGLFSALGELQLCDTG